MLNTPNQGDFGVFSIFYKIQGTPGVPCIKYISIFILLSSA